MFDIGNKVVYPTQGIGIISNIEKREFKGEKQDYYKIKIFNNTMTLSLPVSRAGVSNLRLISDSEAIDIGLESINNAMSETNDYTEYTSKERMDANSKRIKSGSLRSTLEIIYDLTQVKINSKLNATEKQVLRNAEDSVIKEISYAKELSIEDSTNLLKNAIKY
ncbi:CarD family transcriptional regulator [Clostridium sp. BL-8]|uniref:CarD family transcriptional regulator n=1 Tax=Clostridium sp. BL-8 TaxID=349938 RepID=UPI0009D08BFE|nr:CarD family transcriptional regulator [Clostridium sp. BL-8]OOM67419.1 RNA polymerase-binding transcription factor CarD [Clostridium sp. BL-8]